MRPRHLRAASFDSGFGYGRRAASSAELTILTTASVEESQPPLPQGADGWVPSRRLPHESRWILTHRQVPIGRRSRAKAARKPRARTAFAAYPVVMVGGLICLSRTRKPEKQSASLNPQLGWRATFYGEKRLMARLGHDMDRSPGALDTQVAPLEPADSFRRD
jgi:hypothetical protein